MDSLLAATTTTVLNVHAGRALPIARAVVIAVPAIALSVFAWLRTRRPGPRP